MEENPNEFWNMTEGGFLTLRHGLGGSERYIFVEDLYQQFKARLMAELVADVHSSPESNLLEKCAKIAEWHIGDSDECGVLAREVLGAIRSGK